MQLVNRVLTEKHGLRIAVILNDFGDNLGIEKALVHERSRQIDKTSEKERTDGIEQAYGTDAFGDAAGRGGGTEGEGIREDEGKGEGEAGGKGEGEAVVEEWMEVGNGCICCSVKHSFVLALEGLMARQDR